MITEKHFEMDYKREFRYFDFEIPSLPEGFRDDSWHNNVCPSFIRILDDQIITLWVDYKNPKRRELKAKQFFVTSEPNNDEINEVTHLFETNSWQVAMNKIDRLFKKAKK
jgi:hypothetical protein